MAGILLVGAIVFGGLSLWAGRGSGAGDTTTSTSAGPDITTTTTSTTSPVSTIDETTSTSSTSTTTTAPTSTTIREVRSPSEVTVVVLNSTGRTGLAADLTGQLEGLGYETLPPDNYSPTLSDTTIFYADGFSLEAQALAESVPDAILSTDQDPIQSSGADLVVVIGSSYPG
ncbi:MAG: LytR C-terminal domain-containing protein [Acidimicrobiia bacterium]